MTRGPALTPGDDVRTGFDERGVRIDFESPECVAKQSLDQKHGSARYWLRRAVTGPKPGSLFNTAARYYQMAVPPAQSVDHDSYLWCPVTEACFDAYMRFLATQNPEYYQKAERLACQRTS